MVYVVLEYDRTGERPTVMYGEVYEQESDAVAFADEQNSMCKFVGRSKRFRAAALAPMLVT